ncbi:hypothetical protein FB45DRAFT_253788 [Roridomyces roridus]|uniref:Uncharacterized protein n=1 Tax=Roridomyces roridus TaxID=1738132 RepID=A0AAD7FDT4_9AGAR|nr:hypothetical protein FB45DRAFT_253788 [Roridomyces roridus]
MSWSLALAVLLSVNARLVAAQNDPNGDRRHVTPSAAAIGFVVAAVVLFLFCCCVQRRRVHRLKATRLPPLPLTDATFPHGLQYVGTRPSAQTTPTPTTTPFSYRGYQTEYPPASAADFAPPPYVKEGGAGPYSPPPGPPPPPIDAVPGPAPGYYAPPPGPPPRAHISSNSADFNGGFRPPPVS